MTDEAAIVREIQALRSEIASLRHQVSAFSGRMAAQFALQESVLVDTPVPPLSGWSLEPEALLMATQAIVALPPRSVIVELGSGVSSLWLGRAARSNLCRVKSIEHDDQFLERTLSLLSRTHMDDCVSVSYAPLSEYGGQGREWYTGIDAITDPIGLLVVDGPPRENDPMVRLPALHRFADQIQQGGYVLIDDATAGGDRRVLDSWLEWRSSDGQFHQVQYAAGAALLRLLPSSSNGGIE